MFCSASCGDLFHSTDWQTLCDRDPVSCTSKTGSTSTGGGGGSGGAAAGTGGGCTAGDQIACYSGPAGTEGIGICKAGTKTCNPDGSGYGACQGEVTPQTEDCTTIADENCDGAANAGCDLVVYFGFDEGSGSVLVDSSGNHNDGKHDASYAPGKRGSALVFDGTAMATVPSSTTLVWGDANVDFTIAYWVRVTSGPTGVWRSVFHKGNSDCGMGDRTSANFLNPMAMDIQSTVSTTAADAGCDQEVATISGIPLDTWVHLAIVKHGASFDHYVDASLTATVSIQPSESNTGPLYIGKDPWYAGLNGLIDEFRVYSRALSSTEIGVLAAP